MILLQLIGNRHVIGHMVTLPIIHYSDYYSLLGLYLHMDYYYYSLHLFVVCSRWPAAPGGWNSSVHIHLTQLSIQPNILVWQVEL